MIERLRPTAPATPAEWEAYFGLRYRVLRAPWNQPPGTERDSLDMEPALAHAAHVAHRCVFGEHPQTGQFAAFACGRVQLVSPTEAQVRYMASDPALRGKGLGRKVLAALEVAAANAGARSIVLQARENAVAFYESSGYALEAPTFLLFGEIRHFRMTKALGVRHRG